MAELILGSVVESLTGRVLSFLSGEIGLTCCVKLELKKLERTLSLMGGVLQDAEKRQVNDEAVKIWLKELKDLAYEADDLLDDFNTEAIRRRSVAGGRKKMVNEVSIFFSSSNQLIYAIWMAHRIKNFRGNLDDLIKDSERFKLISISENPILMELHHNRPLTVPSDYERYVVGRDEDTKHVINFLLDPNFEENLSILSIVGFGGMGKTTLARLVFKDDERLKDHFQQKIWVYVSTNFVAENILRNILQECVEESRKDEIARLQMSRLHDMLRVELGEKKFLLVLDDVWTEDRSKWLTLQNHLPYGAKGSKMLVTTRSFGVANTVGSHKSHNLSGLPEEESLTLLMKMANKKEDEWKNKNLENIAKGILKKCGGVPLAIMTIGGLLSSRFSEREWSTLLHEDFSRIEQEGDIMPTLKISYDFLPSHLKQCFAYCCLFPKDYELDPNELVHLWMAQGFIFKSRDSSKTLHDVGKGYFIELASRSFFQDVERDRLGNITECKMHDLMHDLATMVAGDNYTTLVNGSSASDEDIPKEVRHVSMGDDKGSYNLKSLGPNQRIIRSLLFINQYQDINFFSGDISSFRNLRAIRLHQLAKGDVLPSIGKLKHLRSLDLSWSTKLTSLPNSIGKLLNLETLILYKCEKLESLPREVTKLINLRYLDMRGCHMRSIAPLDQLPSLESILLGDLEELEWIEVTENSICLYPSLRELELAGLPMFKGWKSKKMDVNRSGDQAIHSSSPFFIPSFSEKVKVRIDDCRMLCCTWNDKKGVSLQVGGMKYKDLEELWRRNRSNVKEEEAESSSISTAPMGSLTFVPLSSVRLQTLTSLHLNNLEDTEELPLELFRSLSRLQSLKITKCHHIRSIPPLDQLSSLKSIKLRDCNNIRSIPPLDQLSSLESIKLRYCKNIRSIPPLDQLPSLKSILLGDLEKLEWIEVTENSICLYPSLENIRLYDVRMLKGWKRKRMDVNRSGDQTIHSSSSSLFFIPSFSRKVQVLIGGFEMLSCMWNDNERVSLELQSMKYKDLEELSKSRRNVEEEESSSISTTQMGSLTFVPLSSVPLHKVTSLYLINLEDTEELPMELFQSLSRLQSLEITKCRHMRSIPPLDQLPSLKSIKVIDLQELEWIEVTENSICLYPSLERVCLNRLPMFKGWKRMRMDVNRSGDQTIHSSSPFFIPSFSRKVDVRIDDCRMLCCTWNGDGGVWLQVGGMKYKDLEEELWRRNRRNVEEEEVMVTQMGSLTFVPLSSVPLHEVTSLSLHHLEDTEELPLELFQSLSRVQSLEIAHCHHMRSIPPLDQLPSLKSISLEDMEKLEWIEVTENKSICLYPSLERVYLEELPMLKGWKRKRMDVNRSGDQTIHSSSSSLFFIPSFSRKFHVEIYECEIFSYMRDDNEGVSLQVQGMKYKDLEELCRRNRSNVEEEDECSLTLLPLSSVPLRKVTSLSLLNLEDTEELPSELFQSLSHLQSLEITKCHHIWSIPPLDQLSSLESINLSHCNNIRSISPLDQLPSLKNISLEDMEKLEWIEVTENKSIRFYPSLGRVFLNGLPMLKGWKSKRMDVNRSGDQAIHSSSPFFIPSFSEKVKVKIDDCRMLCCTWNDKKGVSLQVGGMKYKDLEELWRRNRSNVKEEEEESSSISTTRMGSLTFVPLSSVPLHMLTSLHLINLEDTEELPLELFQSLSRLQSLKITDYHRLKSLSGWAILLYLRSLEYLDIRNNKELDLSSMDQEEDNKAIQGIPNSQTKMRELTLIGMDKMKSLPPWIQYLHKLETLALRDCKNMETLPGWFSQLTSLKTLKVIKCGELSRKCQRDTGECWPRISHIEHVHIPYEEEAA